MTGASASQGVKVDDAVTQVWAVNCVFHGNQTAFESGNATNISFVNNSCFGPEGVFISGGGSCRVLNNVIYATGAWAIRSLILSSDHNLYHAPTGAVGPDGTNLDVTHASGQGTGIGGDANSVSADPQFIDAPNEDFHLQTASPALDLGTAAGWDVPVTDALSCARNLGGASDMGAFEDR